MKKYKINLLIAAVFLIILLYACADGDEQIESGGIPPDLLAQPEIRDVSGELIITFDYEKIPGIASNQFAVWIEDSSGDYIRTLYATRWTANGGYKTRPDSIALWVAKSNLASMQQSEVDAIAGATPASGSLSYSWDLTGANGITVSPGEYKFFVEGTLRWKNHVIYAGVINIGDSPATAEAAANFIYEASDTQAALENDSPENAMISMVTASFIPAVN